MGVRIHEHHNFEVQKISASEIPKDFWISFEIIHAFQQKNEKHNEKDLSEI